MKRSLISTVLTLTLLASFDFSPAPAAEFALEALTGSSPAAPAPPVETELIARGFRGGGGRRGGGGGFRRGGGGFRRGGGGGIRRTSGGRSAARSGGDRHSATRSGGYRSARSGAHRTASAHRTGAHRSSVHAQTRHAGAHSAHSKSAHAQNSHAKNGQSKGGKNGQSKNGNGKHSGRNGGRNGGGGYWNGGAIVPVDITPDVVPITPDVVPVVPVVNPAVITLVNPEDIHTPVYYTIASEQYVLQAGEEISHGNERQVITFNRGGSFGDASYTLAPGIYRFVATDHGWDLHTVTDESMTERTVASNDTEETTSTTTTAAITKDTNPLQWLSGR